MKKSVLADAHEAVVKAAQLELVCGHLVGYIDRGVVGDFVPICVIDSREADRFPAVRGTVAGWTAPWDNYAPEEAWFRLWTPEGDIVVTAGDRAAR